VLAGDIVGYSRLVHGDEDEALAKVKHAFEMVDTVVKLRGGRIAKTMGDGFIAEFASVVAAFEAARAILENIKNKDTYSVSMRMGLHVGDIIVEEDGDILGNGVNIAARLEAFAQPGNIAVSSRAADELLRRKITFVHHGPHQLKNIDEPVDIYEYGNAQAEAEEKSKADGKAKGANKPKVYVRASTDNAPPGDDGAGRALKSFNFTGLIPGMLALAGAGGAGWWYLRPVFQPEREITSMSCSWLMINGHNEMSGRDVWSLSGFSIQTADELRQSLLRKAIEQGSTKFDVIVGDIIPIERSQCSWIESAKKLAYLGIPRISIHTNLH